MRIAVVGLIGLAFTSAAQAQNMSAEAFNKRATALAKKGPFALFSRGEINALTTEGSAAGKATVVQRRADLAAGRQPRYCPPGPTIRLSSDEFMQRLTAIPPAERARIDMTEATNRIMAAKFPCKA